VVAINVDGFMPARNQERQPKRQLPEWADLVLWYVVVSAAGLILVVLLFFLGRFGFFGFVGRFGLYGDPSDAFWWWVIPVALFAAAWLPFTVWGKLKTDKARLVDEQKQAERRRQQEEKQAELRRQQERESTLRIIAEANANYEARKKAQAQEEEAQAHREEVERLHRERPNLEPFVVGDEQTGIRSPYEVEMNDREKALLDAISSKFDPACVFVDTYLDRGDGRTTQIDIIAICRQGIIVIESKGLGGTMAGRTDDKEWIHKPSQLHIQNPIEQNALHVQSIHRVLKPPVLKARVLKTRVLKPIHTREDSDDIPF
jgi:hypothetical protein